MEEINKNHRSPIEEIRNLAALYMRGLDRLDAALLIEQFWDDAYLNYGIYEGDVPGFAAFCMEALGDNHRNHHMIGQHTIDFDGDEAFGEVYYQAYHKVTDEAGHDRDVFISGRYVDRYERRSGIWKIAYRSELVDWATDAPSSDAFLETSGFLIGKRKPDDPLYNRSGMRKPGAKGA